MRNTCLNEVYRLAKENKNILFIGSDLGAGTLGEMKNDLPLGRNIDEMLILIDALDHHNKHGEVCPAGWAQGKTGMKPSDEGMRAYLANSTEEL